MPAHDKPREASDAEAIRELRETANAAGERLSDEVRAELARLRADVERLIGEKLGSTLGEAAGTVQAASSRARDRIEHDVEAISGVVRDWPLLSLAAAALGGFLVGRLIAGGSTHIHTGDRAPR